MKRKLLSLSLVLLLGLSLLLPVCAETLSDGTAFFTKDATLIKSGYLGETVQFAKKDFKQALGTKKISMITVTSLPDAQTGSLLLASSRVSEGDTIPFSALDLLKFVPASKEVAESGFSFTAGNLAGGAQILCQIRLLDKKNAAPTVSGSTLSVSFFLVCMQKS